MGVFSMQVRRSLNHAQVEVIGDMLRTVEGVQYIGVSKWILDVRNSPP